MVIDILEVQTEDDAWRIIQSFASEKDNVEVNAIKFGSWAYTHVYIKDSKTTSAIRAPFMEAFVSLQKQIYQLAAYAQTQIADSRQLSDLDRREFEIDVYVTGGSDDYKVVISKALERLIGKTMGKMSGRQITIVVCCLALLFAANRYWVAWLEQQKDIHIEELRSKDHIEALQDLSFANKEQSEELWQIIKILSEQGSLGNRAYSSVQSYFDALLKAASRTDLSTINGQELSSYQAESLRTSGRKPSTTRYVIQQMRVVDINTADLDDVLVLMDPSTQEQLKTKMPSGLFSADDRGRLFIALSDRQPIWVELAIREVGDDIRNVEFIHVSKEPPANKGEGAG
jgi:hypothetical protein